MNRSKLPQRLFLLALPTALLTGCFSSGPEDKLFLENAAKQLRLSESPVCLQLPSEAEATSAGGGLPRGWLAFAESSGEQDYSGYQRRETLPRLEALVAAGLLVKEPYEIYKGGQLRPGSRYFMSPEGATALTTQSYGTSCLSLGRWEPSKLVPLRSATAEETKPQELIRKKTEGDAVSYEALVAANLVEQPTWAASPGLASAYAEQLAAVRTGKAIKVELVEFNKSWVSKQVLALQMAKDASTYRSTSEAPKAPIVEIPADLQDMALAKMGTAARGFGGRVSTANLALPSNASETPQSRLRTHPGEFFLSEQPDMQALARSSQSQRVEMLAVREASLAHLPQATKEAALAAIAKERAAIAQAQAAATTNAALSQQDNRASDRYLNNRKELKELLDVLVEAGAYTKKSVAKGELPGTDQAGELYVPAPGTRVMDNVVQLGTPKYSGPFKQTVTHNGNALSVTVNFELVDKPVWFDAAAKKIPGLASRAKGTQTFMARATENAEFPYTLMPGH